VGIRIADLLDKELLKSLGSNLEEKINYFTKIFDSRPLIFSILRNYNVSE